MGNFATMQGERRSTLSPAISVSQVIISLLMFKFEYLFTVLTYKL